MPTINKIKPYKGIPNVKNINIVISELNKILIPNTYSNQKIYINENDSPNISIYLDRGNIINLYVDNDINIQLYNPNPGSTYYLIVDQWTTDNNYIVSWLNTIKWYDNTPFTNLNLNAGNINMIKLYYDGINFYGWFENESIPYA